MWFLPCYIKYLNAICFDARLWFNAEDGFEHWIPGVILYLASKLGLRFLTKQVSRRNLIIRV